MAFAQNSLDRQSEHREETALPEALDDPSTRFFAIVAGRLVMRFDGERLEGLLDRNEIEELKPDKTNAILLGWDGKGAPRVALPVGRAEDELPDHLRALDPRSIYRQQLLDVETLGAYAQANSMAAWAASTRHCGRCGHTMMPEAGGYRRRCANCDNLSFPRTDPVAIMLAIDESRDRCLLGRSFGFQPGMYSCLAGFIEPGETMENAVRRETFEESGIRIGRVRYHASQPWPVPHSLMIGVLAEATSFEISRDTHELEDCRWFSRMETEAMLATSLGDAAATPPPGAIAHRLMRDWLDWKR